MTATRTWRAWSCTVRLTVTDARIADPAAAQLAEILTGVDAVASRFRADSALSAANRLAGRPVPVPRALVELVADALDAAAATDGAVDPTIGRDLVALGYDRDIALVRGQDVAPVAPTSTSTLAAASTPAAAARARRATWRDVRLDRTAGLLTVPRGVALDLGATAKAATADRAAIALHRRFGGGVLVELGGDLAVAGPGSTDRGWPIAVAEAEGAPAQQIFLTDGGLATSTTTVRAWRQGGAPVHHVLDPRTGRPVDGTWRTATVAAPCALAANVASTAALVLGDGAVTWLSRRGLAARLVTTGGAVRSVGGWPEPAATERRAA